VGRHQGLSSICSDPRNIALAKKITYNDGMKKKLPVLFLKIRHFEIASINIKFLEEKV
jgi:hypothetical protein